MDRIRSLFQTFSKAEVRYLKASLKAFHNKGNNRGLKLIEYLEKAPEISNADMAELLYGDPRSKAFIMLKGRLLDRMMEVMTLQVNLQNDRAVREDPARLRTINMYKMLSHAILLQLRGLYDLAKGQLHKALDMAQASGNTEIELLCLSLLCSISSSIEEVNDTLRPGMATALEVYRTDLLALGIFTDYRLRAKADKLVDDEAFADYLDHELEPLTHRLSVHYGLRAHSFQLILLGQIYQLRRSYDAARRALQERMALLENHPELGLQNRLGALYFQLADLEARCCRFDEAIEAAKQVKSYFSIRKPNYIKANVVMLFSFLYQGKLEEVRGLIQEIRETETVPRSTMILSVVTYLEACWFYLRGQRNKSLLVLMEERALTQDKSGWNVGIRIFEIMILIEDGEFDLADAKVEALRKHIAKHGTDERNRLIFRILYQTSRLGYNLEEVTENYGELFSQLGSTYWSSIGHEVVRFETWLSAYESNRPYLEVMLEQWAMSDSTKQGGL